MEPVTLGLIGFGLYAWLKKQKATPAAAAQTVSAVDQVAAALVAGQVPKASELKGILASQIKALGFTLGGHGHPPDPNGVTVAEYVVSPPAYSPVVAQTATLSGLWSKFAYDVAVASKDTVISQDEALSIAAEAQGIALLLYDMSVAVDQYQKKTPV